MKKFKKTCILLVFGLALTGCGTQKDNAPVDGTADETPVISFEEKNDMPTATAEGDNNTTVMDEGDELTDVSEEDNKITDEAALAAIKNYCYKNNPDLKEMVDSGEYEVYWEIGSGDENEVVVLYRSYTAAIVRYYIDRTSGDTYVTEFVEGITPNEERTDETFNVKDYM
ncbi:MAG: hypothetical protein K6G27_08430 [Lachnospiraceae bacterium]|nr:hypothetical protein [Lachnospiraceae bacterium]